MKIKDKITKKHEFKDRLKEAMTRLNVSQSALVQQTNIPKSAMSQYLSGAFVPKHERMSALAQALNVQEAWLIGYDVPMNRDIKIAIYNEESGSYDDENPHILKICEIMEKADVDTQINICRQADAIAQGLSPEQLTESEQLLLTAFRQIPEDQQRVFLEMGRVYANSLNKD